MALRIKTSAGTIRDINTSERDEIRASLGIEDAPVVPAPVFTSQPTITGTSQVGQVLTAVDGTASNTTTLTRKWYMDDAEIVGETGASYTLIAGDVGKVPGLRNFATGPGGGPVQSSLATAAAVGVVIGGIVMGAAGAGALSGFKMVAGDDFDTAPTRWSGRNITGDYTATTPSYGFRGTRPDHDYVMYIDPDFAGARSQSPAVLGYDGVSFASSVATLTASLPPEELKPFLPTTYTANNRGDGQGRPRLISGSLKTTPKFAFSAQADHGFECRVRLQGGVIRGYWPSFWTTGVFWPDHGEIDVLEGKKTAGGANGNMTTLNNVIVSATDGGSNVDETVSQPAIPADRWVWLLCIKQGGTISFYDDIATEGTLALRGSTTARVGRLKGLHDIRLDMAAAAAWDTSVFNPADWPAKVEFDWWRAWVPSAAGNNTAMQQLSPINVTPGGSWATTLPSRSALFGAKAGLEAVNAFWDNFDAPGMATRNGTTKLPSGMTVDLTTRAVSGTVPTTEGGLMGLLIWLAYDDGTPAGRAFLPYRVAPAVQFSLFSDSPVVEGTTVTRTVAYVDFHSGNLGPHTYSVTAPGMTITGNGTGNVSISGTMPAAGGTRTITVECANRIGQKTTAVRTLTSSASGGGFSPDTWDALVAYWDHNDAAKVFADDAGTTPATVGGFASRVTSAKAAYPLVNGSGRPTYVTDENGLKCLDFSGTGALRLTSGASTAALHTSLSGEDAPYVLTMAVKRGTPGTSVTPMAFCRNDASTINDRVRHFLGGTNQVGASRVSGTVETTVSGASGTVSANQWYVVSWVFTGTALIPRVNGVADTPLALNTGPLSINEIALGAMYENDLNAYASVNAFKGRVGEWGIALGVGADDPNIAAYEAYLMAKWTN